MVKDTEPYSGPERRVVQRRKTQDRRVLIRYEPSKERRRKNNGRRKEDALDLSGRREK